jgi:hypothetical protein
MTSLESPQGRRILVAEVTGSLGDRIQAWRLEHDPQQALRLPPHITLCYWAPVVEPETIEDQLRHAFRDAVSVRLTEVHEFDNDQHTFYVQLKDTAALDAARHRLYDGKHLKLPPLSDWSWHVTCVRDSRRRDLQELRRAAADLRLDAEWRVDTVSYLELRGSQYEELARWSV